MKAEAELMDEEYREEITEKLHLTILLVTTLSPTIQMTSTFPGQGFQNVLLIQERMSRTHD